VAKVVKKALDIGSITNQIFPKKRNNITAKTEATAIPKTTRSDLIYSIISEVIIAGPPRYKVALFLCKSRMLLISKLKKN
jgi:hypothetical protein